MNTCIPKKFERPSMLYETKAPDQRAMRSLLHGRSGSAFWIVAQPSRNFSSIREAPIAETQSTDKGVARTTISAYYTRAHLCAHFLLPGSLS